jgi:hypothetical protein
MVLIVTNSPDPSPPLPSIHPVSPLPSPSEKGGTPAAGLPSAPIDELDDSKIRKLPGEIFPA